MNICDDNNQPTTTTKKHRNIERTAHQPHHGEVGEAAEASGGAQVYGKHWFIDVCFESFLRQSPVLERTSRDRGVYWWWAYDSWQVIDLCVNQKHLERTSRHRGVYWWSTYDFWQVGHVRVYLPVRSFERHL